MTVSINYYAVAPVLFPPHMDRYVSMMPYVIGSELQTVPRYLHDYVPMMQACKLPATDRGRVGYLTVDERHLRPGESHRRAGIHTEGAPDRGWGGGAWGRGTSARPGAGIYMANTVPGSCELYNVSMPGQGAGGELTQAQAAQLPEPHLMPAHTLYWMHDYVPHASVPTRPGPRQFFRVVGPEVHAWYAAHSTKNPLGVTPPPGVPIVRERKFS